MDGYCTDRAPPSRSYTCTCDPGYSGNGFSCNAICRSGCSQGSCYRDPYNCKCNAGWGGSICNIPLCNGGVNTSPRSLDNKWCYLGSCGTSSATCSCAYGFSGSRCQTLPTDNYPAVNIEVVRIDGRRITGESSVVELPKLRYRGHMVDVNMNSFNNIYTWWTQQFTVGHALPSSPGNLYDWNWNPSTGGSYGYSGPTVYDARFGIASTSFSIAHNGNGVGISGVSYNRPPSRSDSIPAEQGTATHYFYQSQMIGGGPSNGDTLDFSLGVTGSGYVKIRTSTGGGVTNWFNDKDVSFKGRLRFDFVPPYHCRFRMNDGADVCGSTSARDGWMLLERKDTDGDMQPVTFLEKPAGTFWQLQFRGWGWQHSEISSYSLTWSPLTAQGSNSLIPSGSQTRFVDASQYWVQSATYGSTERWRITEASYHRNTDNGWTNQFGFRGAFYSVHHSPPQIAEWYVHERNLPAQTYPFTEESYAVSRASTLSNYQRVFSFKAFTSAVYGSEAFFILSRGGEYKIWRSDVAGWTRVDIFYAYPSTPDAGFLPIFLDWVGLYEIEFAVKDFAGNLMKTRTVAGLLSPDANERMNIDFSKKVTSPSALANGFFRQDAYLYTSQDDEVQAGSRAHYWQRQKTSLTMDILDVFYNLRFHNFRTSLYAPAYGASWTTAQRDAYDPHRDLFARSEQKGVDYVSSVQFVCVLCVCCVLCVLCVCVCGVCVCVCVCVCEMLMHGMFAVHVVAAHARDEPWIARHCGVDAH
jgi:hypothetical protein